ncbi:SulP family inorganic anion transporter [Cellulomonas sp. P5_C5]
MTGGWGRPTGKDVSSGLVTGLFSIPEGMAYANIGGFNPVVGLYSGVVSTIVGSAFARTVLMVTTLTSAIALSSASVLAGAGLDPHDPGAIATLTLLVGVVMLVLGLLRLGSVMQFVSTAVMTGFTTGIAVQIIAGELGDATGYKPQTHNTVGKIVEALVHVGSWDVASVAVAGATIVVWVLARLVRRLRALATLVALVVVWVGVVVAGIDVEDVGDIAAIPRSLPPFSLPDLSAVPELALGAVAVALVALAQAAGIGAAVPNPDGSRPNMSRDFVAQGMANVAGGLFSALPTGGSLSRTGVATSAGARTRWSGVFAGLWLALVVVLVGPYAETIPMPVIGGLLILIGIELVQGRWKDIVLVVRTSWWSTAAMVVTFLATTQLPLQQAIFLGAGLSLVLYAVSSSRVGRLRAIERRDEGVWVVTDPPAEVPSHSVVVLDYAGAGFFAEVARIEETWPDTTRTVGSALVLSLRTLPDVPSATFVKALDALAERLRARDNLLLLCGVSSEFLVVAGRSGLLGVVGLENVLLADDEIFASARDAVARGQAWVDDHRDARPSDEGAHR